MTVWDWILLLMANIAIASSICLLLGWIASWLISSAVGRHAVLATSVLCCLLVPAVAAGTLMVGMGKMPARWLAVETAAVGSQPSQTDPSTADLPVDNSRNSRSDRDQARMGLESSSALRNPENFYDNRGTVAVSQNQNTNEMGEWITEPTRSVPHSQPRDVSVADQGLGAGSLVSRFWKIVRTREHLARWVASVLVLLWWTVAAGFGFVLIYQQWRLRRFLAGCVPATATDVESLQELCGTLNLAIPAVKLTSSVSSPFVTGLWRPVLVLPSGFRDEFDRNEIQAMLWHELGHLKRKDLWWNQAILLGRVLYWWNPVFRRVTQQMLLLREWLCDDVVVRQTRDDRAYARLLLRLAERELPVQPSHRLEMVTRSQLESRFRRILAGQGSKAAAGLSSPMRVVIAMAMIGLLTGMSYVQFTPVSSRTVTAIVAVPQEEQDDATTVVRMADFRFDGKLFSGKAEDPEVTVEGNVLGPDGEPVANAEVVVQNPSRWSGLNQSVRTDSAGKFQFTVRVGALAESQTQLLVFDPRTTEVGFLGDLASFRTGSDRSVRLELLTQRRVKVVDAMGRAVPGAQVALYPDAWFPLLARTDAEGTVRFELPKSRIVTQLAAWKDQKGLDYRTYAAGFPQRSQVNPSYPRFPETIGETLVLEKAVPLKVRVIDQNGDPLSNVEVAPWLLQKHDQTDHLNLSFLKIQQVTDDQGRVQFSWFPHWQKEQATIWASREGYDRPRGYFEPQERDKEVTIVLQQLVPIRGTVTDPQGNPVSGVKVRFDGRIAHEQPSETTTDSDGKYELWARPEGRCSVAVIDDQWGALPWTLETPEIGGQAKTFDFVVQPTTQVIVTVRNQDTDHPVSGHRSWLELYGASDQRVDSRLREDRSMRPSGRMYNSVYIASPHQDENGQCVLHLGPGVYGFRANDDDDVHQFEVKDSESEPLQVTVKTRAGAMRELSGQVLDQKTRQPIAGAKVLVVHDRFMGDRWESQTDAQGRYVVAMREEPGIVQAVSSDGKRKTIAVISGHETSQNLELQAAATVTGRLLDSNGNPLSNLRLRYEAPRRKHHYGGIVSTDDKGRFRIKGLAPGISYRLGAYETGWLGFELEPGEDRDLGDHRLAK